MREFLLNSEELLDRNALAFLENGGNLGSAALPLRPL